MRKLSLYLILLSVSVMVIACGGNSKDTDKKVADDEGKTEMPKSNDLKTQAGVQATLKAIGFELEDDFSFVEARLDGAYYKSKFTTDTLQADVYNQLPVWFKEQVTKMNDAGWKRVDMREDEKLMGATVNKVILYAPKDAAIDALTVTLSANEKDRVVKLYFSIDR